MSVKRKRAIRADSHQPRKKAPRPATTLSETQLQWKQVDLPDHLDDTEGFYQLEEVDDIEVIPQPGSKELVFKQVKPNYEEPISDDEWQGIEDSPEPSTSELNKSSVAKLTNSEKAPLRSTLKKPSEALESDVSFQVLSTTQQDETDVSAWDGLGLSPQTLTAVAALKFPRPTPVQRLCIPEILAGHDVIGKAQTGSGKTLAFGIPILEYFLDKQPVGLDNNSGSTSTPIALIFSPTRELAQQITSHLTALFKDLPDRRPRLATLVGGLAIQKQQRLLVNADIIVGTPGRLWDVAQSELGFVDRLRGLRFLVVDEADRLLSDGHFKEAEQLLDLMDREIVNDNDSELQTPLSDRQTLVFSATFHRGLQQKLHKRGPSHLGFDKNHESMSYLLQKLSFNEPRPTFVDINPTEQMAETLQEALLECPAPEKDLYLYALLLCNPADRILVFTNAISSTRRLTALLQTLGLNAHTIHSNMPQKARLRNLERFSTPQSKGTIMVASDVAARGLDIQGINLVVHYHVPRTADMYVHRSGRTARAEQSGKSVLICSPDEAAGVVRLISQVHANSEEQRLEVRNMSVDRLLISRVKPRLDLASKIANAATAEQKSGSEDDWLRKAADDLGVDYDSEEFAADSRKLTRGRNRGTRKGSYTPSKAELKSWRAQLKDMLSRRVNLGVSERYLAGGAVDLNALHRGEGNPNFLGEVHGFNF